MHDHERENDLKEPKTVEEFVRQIYNNQKDSVIPLLTDLKTCVFGNGNKGLKDRTTTLETIVTVMAWVTGVVGVPLVVAVVALFMQGK